MSSTSPTGLALQRDASKRARRNGSVARGVALALAVGLGALAAPAHADAPGPIAWAVPDPGRSIASSDDSTAIAVNPANLAFQHEWELRWNWLWTGSASALPITGHSIAASIPVWILASGLRVDLLDPPESAPAPFDDTSQWIRWGLAVRGGDTMALGTTLGWSASDSPSLDDQFSLTSGLTLRPFTFLSLAAVARNWNEPVSRSRVYTLERSYDVGVAVRPTGRRDLEVGLEAAYQTGLEEWTPRATLGIDVPRLGRLRGDVTLLDASGDRSFAAMAGLDLNAALFPMLQVSGGGVFGDAITRSGTGFYAGAAIRGFREPGVVLPGKVARIRIESTPGARGHVRLLRRLWRLTSDPEVEGVLLVLRDDPASSLAHAEEVGEAIRGLRARGKKVICHLESAGGRGLYVCSQADKIAINPAGGIRFAGLASQYFYFGKLLQNLGVRADIVRIGKHKLAAEQFALPQGTDVADENHQDLINQYERVYLHDVGGGRRIATDELKRRIARGPFLAHEAQAAGLVDLLAYEDELDRVVEETFGHRIRVVDDDPLPRARARWGDPSKLAIVYLAGDMIDGDSRYIPFLGIRLAGSYTIARALKRAREDPTIKAVVFRIETGGGSSLAADVILREALLTAKAKPLVVSMGSAAASGGYYAAVAGKPIFANRATVTGSIGIFYGKVDFQQLLGKVGVKVQAFRTAPRADAESLFRPFTDDEHRELGAKVKQFYDTFVARVAAGRNMTPEQVDSVARGRVWTGAQAHERGLVDRIGGLRAAMTEARKRGGLAHDCPIAEMPEDDDSLLKFLLDLSGLSTLGSGGQLAAAIVPPALLDLARGLAPFFIFSADTPLARMEYMGEPTFGTPDVVEEP
jgi:protease-4